MAHNFGETAALSALRKNIVALTDAIQRHIAVFPRYLKQANFMTKSQWDNVASTTGKSNAEKANDYMSTIESKVCSSNPDRGRKWLKELLVILSQKKIDECVVAQSIAKVYSKCNILCYADS